MIPFVYSTTGKSAHDGTEAAILRRLGPIRNTPEAVAGVLDMDAETCRDHMDRMCKTGILKKMVKL